VNVNAVTNQKPASDKTWLTKKEISAYFGWSIRQTTNLVRQRKLPFCRPSKRCIRFNLKDCEAAMKAFEVKNVASLYHSGGFINHKN